MPKVTPVIVKYHQVFNDQTPQQFQSQITLVMIT